MTWHSPGALWALLLVPTSIALLVWQWHKRKQALDSLGTSITVQAMLIGRPGRWRASRALLWILGVTLIVAALAGPQYGSRTTMLKSRGIDMVIALDFSKSMLARDVRPNRIDRAKAELGRLLSEMDGTRIGVVAFAGETIEFPMTVDFAAVRLFLRDLGPYDLPVGGTAIGRSLNAAQELLERTHTGGAGNPPPSRVVILITDGEDHEGDPVEVAQQLSEAGTRIYVIGIGSEAGEPIPTYARDGTWTGYLRDDDGELVLSALTPENEETLTAIAETSGGRYIRAEGGTVGIEQLREEMSRMRQQERDSRRVTVHEDRYALLLFPGFLLILLETLLPQAWIGRRRRRSTQTGGSA